MHICITFLCIWSAYQFSANKLIRVYGYISHTKTNLVGFLLFAYNTRIYPSSLPMFCTDNKCYRILKGLIYVLMYVHQTFFNKWISILLILCIIFHASRNYRDIFNLCCIEGLLQNSAENWANNTPPPPNILINILKILKTWN